MERGSRRLAQLLADTGTTVQIGGVYQHYKNRRSRYTVVQVAIIESTLEPCVIYRSLENPELTWVRPLSDWLAMVQNEHGKSVSRFVLVEAI